MFPVLKVHLTLPAPSYFAIGDFSWDWATVRATGGGGYYLEGDNWGVIDPVATSIFL